MNVGPEWKWEHWAPILWKVVFLVVSGIIASYGSFSIEDVVKGELKTTESQANEVIKVEEILAGEYENFYEYIRWHDQHEAACDSALESFAMHRDDERDWTRVIKVCHSKGVIE